MPTSAIIVDDNVYNLKLMAAILEKTACEVRSFTRGEDALESALGSPPDIVLLDLAMPGMSGFEVCTRLKSNEVLKEIPVLFISASSQQEDIVRAFAAGAVDYVTKPFQMEEVLARVKTHLELRKMKQSLEQQNRNLQHLVDAKVEELRESHTATIFAMAKLSEQRDNETARHVERVRSYADLIARRLRKVAPEAGVTDDQFIADLFHASPLHDIGKVAVSDTILLKPGKLTAEEISTMRTHTIMGYKTIRSVWCHYPQNKVLSMGMEVTRSHHECWDGTGYPDGLAGTNIPLAGRLLAVADVYDALRSERVYKRAFAPDEAGRAIRAGNGKQFDPLVVRAFLAVEQEFCEISYRLNDTNHAEPGSARSEGEV